MKFLFLIIIILPTIFFAQTVELNIKDYDTKKAIPYARIVVNRKAIAITDADGVVKLSTQYKFVDVSAMGYDTVEVILGSEKQIVYLNKFDKQIKQVIIKPKPDEFANRLIRSMIDRFDDNLPEKLPSYQLMLYSKFTVDVQPDSFSSKLIIKDSITKKDSLKTTKNDSMDKELLDFSKHSKLFVWEKASLFKHDINFGKKKILLTSKMSGFKQPIYELLAISLDDIGTLPSIFRNETYKDYTFNLEDSLMINHRKTYEVGFFPIKKYKTRRSRSGRVFIDSLTKALIKYQGNRKDGYAEINNQLIQEKCFTKDIVYNLTNGMIQVSGGKSITTYKLKVEQIETPKAFTKAEFNGNINDISVNLNDKKSLETLEVIRGKDTLDAREANTYVSLDSIIERKKIGNKLRLLLAATKGYFKYKSVNLNLIDIIQINRYEGFRAQIGGMTNHEFSSKWNLNGYIAYGFKDERFKGGFGVKLKLNYYNNTSISLNYQNDVLPVGREQNDLALFKDKQDYLLQLLYFGNYYHSQNIKFGIQTDVNRNLEQKTYVQYSDISVKFPYLYDGQIMENMSVWTAGIQFRFYPKSEYITTPEGKFAVKEKPTQFLFNYAFHFPSNKNISYYQNVSLDMTTSIKSNLGRTNIYTGIGTTISQAPILSLFEGKGSSISNDNLYKTFGISSLKYFATMEPNTFYSNHFANLFVVQNIPPIRLSAEKRLYFGVTYKALVGILDAQDKHSISLQAPTKIYQEIGLEWNKVFKILGLGIYSRIGEYRDGSFENNLAGRLTIKL